MLALTVPDKQTFRLDEVAALLSVHVNTVRRWCDEGKLEPVIILPGGHRRVTKAAVVKLVAVRA